MASQYGITAMPNWGHPSTCARQRAALVRIRSAPKGVRGGCGRRVAFRGETAGSPSVGQPFGAPAGFKTAVGREQTSRGGVGDRPDMTETDLSPTIEA